MPFKNRKLAKKVTESPCAWCGWAAGRRHAAHIIDEGPNRKWNAISLCPNCHSVFEEQVRPRLYRALKEFGVQGLPASWAKDNKLSTPSMPPANSASPTPVAPTPATPANVVVQPPSVGEDAVGVAPVDGSQGPRADT